MQPLQLSAFLRQWQAFLRQYIAAFIAGWVQVKLHKDAFGPLREAVVFMDTDLVIFVSKDGVLS